jgi:hypothetical protein
MNKFTRMVLPATLLMAVGVPAFSGTLYASAGYTGAETGDYLIGNDGSNYELLAAEFTLAQTSQITGVGGVFTAYGDSNPIFAAIVAAPSNQSALNLSTLPTLALAQTSFTPPQDDSDATTPLSVTLGPGSYELVFGAGMTVNGQPVTGQSGLATGQSGSATLFQSLDGGADWGTLTDSVRVTVEGTPVPLPASLPLLAVALGGMLLTLRRRGAALGQGAALSHGAALG